jgi:ABC-type nitrate/sulfonate/bicarbonate transport system substrate-binding protein
MIVIFGCISLIASSVGIAQEKVRSVVRLSYIPGNFALPVLVGIEHGLFAREGLSVSAIPVTNEGAIMSSLSQGGTDFAIGSQSLLLSAAQNKLDIKVVAIAGYARNIDLIVPIWDTTTKSFSDVKGKALLLLNGVHNFDAVPELYRAMALSKPPMRLADVTIRFIDLINLQPILDPKMQKAYTQGKVAGIFMFREFSSAYVEQKKARVVLSSEDLTKLIGRIGAQPVFASKRVLDAEPKTAELFIRAWARTMQYMSDSANKDAIVRVLQIYYLRQYGTLLKKELAELYFSSTKYDRVAWDERDIAEVAINAKALSAARNLLFASIKDPKQRPFSEVPDVKAFVDSSMATKALAELESQRKAAINAPPSSDANPATRVATPKSGDKPEAAPPAAKNQNSQDHTPPKLEPSAPPAKNGDKPAVKN